MMPLGIPLMGFSPVLYHVVVEDTGKILGIAKNFFVGEGFLKNAMTLFSTVTNPLSTHFKA